MTNKNIINIYKWFALPLCLTISSCATIISGSTQKIKVTSVPDAVTVTAEPGAYRVQTPAELTLPRLNWPYTVKFEKDGYEPVEFKLERGTNGWVWGNILIGGLIGIIVDYNNGSAHKLSPDKLHANMVAAKPKIQIPDDKGAMLIFNNEGSLLAIITLEK